MSDESFGEKHEHAGADILITPTGTKSVSVAVYFEPTFLDAGRRAYLIRKIAEIVSAPEPTAAEIRSAHQQCLDYCEMIPAQRKPMLAKLRELRERKFSWTGVSENALRSLVDAYLERNDGR